MEDKLFSLQEDISVGDKSWKLDLSSSKETKSPADARALKVKVNILKILCCSGENGKSIGPEPKSEIRGCNSQGHKSISQVVWTCEMDLWPCNRTGLNKYKIQHPNS